MLSHVHDALRQVALIRGQLRDSTRFRGYSGTARIGGGFVALIGALLLTEISPTHPLWYVAGWCLVGVVSFSINYGTLLYYRGKTGITLTHQAVTDPFTVLIISGIITIGVIRAGAYSLLYGVWMVFFGLMHLGARKSLSRESMWLGWYYIGAGALCLLFMADAASFLNPWPMGVVFFLGEMAGGIIFARMRQEVES